MNNNNLRSIVAAGLVLLMLGGCATLEYVPIDRSKPETLRSQLAVGETVIVRLHNGDHREFRVLALEPDAIVGRHERIAYQDIDLVEVKKVDYDGTAKTALAVTALAAVVIAAVIVDVKLDEKSRTTTRCDSNGAGACIPR